MTGSGEEPTEAGADDGGDAIAADTAAFRRYLRAKRTVDDRALDRRLVGVFRKRLAARAAEAEGPLRVLEAGAGLGTMVARLIDWEVLPPGETRYAAVDLDAGAIAGLRPFLRDWAAERDASVSVADAGEAVDGDAFVVETDARTVAVESVAADAVEYAAARSGEWDALIGTALLDVLDFDGLEPLLDALAPGGTYYFPITFDGGTRFRPAHPADKAIERRYHAHMDAKPGGSSRAGGDALERLRATEGATLLGVAGSDWVVRPVEGVTRERGSASAYPGDEAFFLRHILDTVERAVGEVIERGDGDPDARRAVSGDLDPDFPSDPAAELDEWLAHRRRQLDAGDLVYLTHQLDLIGRVDEER